MTTLYRVQAMFIINAAVIRRPFLPFSLLYIYTINLLSRLLLPISRVHTYTVGSLSLSLGDFSVISILLARKCIRASGSVHFHIALSHRLSIREWRERERERLWIANNAFFFIKLLTFYIVARAPRTLRLS